MQDLFISFLKSRRFWVMLAGVAVVVLKDFTPFTPDQITAVVLTIGSWIVGESIRSSRLPLIMLMMLAVGAGSVQAQARQIYCPDGRCDQQPSARGIALVPLQESVLIENDPEFTREMASPEDRLDITIRATVRVTVSGVCGSGTVVGRDSAGNALVLTNAHVAGTTRGREVNLERWEPSGKSERGRGSIISAGYGRGMSVDFALLKCNAEFAKNVTPIPLANRYPDPSALVTTYGCPRCEWPSLQVLALNKRESQILTWKPEAIGGRSGSSVVDYTASGPRVVGLLTWGGGGEGLGQSTPFLINAMQGRLPVALESLPPGVYEVSDDLQEKCVSCVDDVANRALDQSNLVCACWPPKPLNMFGAVMANDDDEDMLGQIVEPKPKPEPKPDSPNEPDGKPDSPHEFNIGTGWVAFVVVVLACVVSASLARESRLKR
jgi:hypothetical protein